MKKIGSTHADWAVSLGIFLVYTLSLFLLIQPGVEPIFKNENLIKIVEDSFVRDTRLVVEKTPIIFNPIEIIPDEAYAAGIFDNIPIVGKVGKGFDETDFSIRNNNNEALRFEMGFGVDASGHPIITRIKVDADFLQDDVTTLYLLYSPRVSGQQAGIYGPPTPPMSETIISENGQMIGGERRNNFTRIFGSTEVMSGIDREKLSLVSCEDADTYSALKERWNYPSNKDFQIFMISTTDPRYTVDQISNVCNQVQPYEQANVFVQDRIDNTLDRDGNKESVRVSIRLW